MSSHYDRAGLFGALKQVLRAKGMVYKDLAAILDVSEPTIKRLFQEQDCKLSRILDICTALNIEFSELVEISKSREFASGTRLAEEVEAYLAANKDLAAFFILLTGQFDVAQIAAMNHLSDSDVYRYLRELEKLQLLRLGKNNTAHLLVERPIKWRLDGPLHETLVQVNKRFIEEAIREYQPELYPLYATSRLLSRSSVEQLNEQVHQVFEQFQRKAALDQSFYPISELQPYRLVLTLKPFSVQNYFPVKSFAKTDMGRDG